MNGYSSASTSTSTGTSSSTGGSSGTGTGGNPASPASTAVSTLTPSAVPSGFPSGTYSFVTFLDTVISNCTANTDTWTCAPGTTYYADPQKALTVLNWAITGSSGNYKISTTGQDHTFGISFQNEKLQLLDAGKDTERYYFQISRTKTVNMTGTIGDQQGNFQCDYGATNMQGALYTKMQRSYPRDTIAVGNTGNPAWPYGE